MTTLSGLDHRAANGDTGRGQTGGDDGWADPTLVAGLRAEVAAGLEAAGAALGRADREALAVELTARALDDHARACLQGGRAPLGPADEAAVARAVRAELFGLGRLEPLLADPSITDIHIVGADPVIVDLADGTRRLLDPVVDADDELVELARSIGRTEGLSERRFDLAHPQLNQQLRDGSRMFAVNWVTRRPHLFIRRHRLFDATLAGLVDLGSIDAGLAAFLGASVRARRNLLVAGGMGVGKTTLLRALAGETDPSERIVTVETDYELGLDRPGRGRQDVIAMEAREANVEGVGAVSCADLVRSAMRMAASRILVGEVLGAEVIPMLNAMHSGASGSMCTVHANSSADAMAKLALLAVQAPERLEMPHTYALAARAVDLVIFMTRVGARRVVASAREVTGADGAQVSTNELWAPGPDGRAVRTAVAPTETTRRALAHAGWQDRP